MARAVGDGSSAEECRRLFENGKKWVDANLFNGEYYIQKVVGRAPDEVAPGLLVGMGSADHQRPDYQMGEACLVDQLLGQYMAHIVGLGYLLDEEHVKKTLKSVYRHNFRVDLSEHEAVQRIYALNDDGGVLVASYPSGKRPAIPFPYFAEVWTGLEYQYAAHLAYEGMFEEALAVVETARRRHDGERRNPWNEPECGHHYARALSSWAVLLALNGFHYSGPDRRLTLTPRVRGSSLRSFWTLPSGWGSFSHGISATRQRVEIRPVEGALTLTSLAVVASGKSKAAAKLGSDALPVTLRTDVNRHVVAFEREIRVTPEQPLTLTLRA
jgi:hypothetical protein